MKFALFNDFQLGLIENDTVYDIGHAIGAFARKSDCPMVDFIRQFASKTDEWAALKENALRFSLSEVRLRQPLARPGKIVAAPVNYVSHQQEMKEELTARNLGFFLKAQTSIIGPGDTVMLPYADRRIDHELELAFVIGKTAKNVSREEALDYVFGYTGLIDVTLRPDEVHIEERCLRKSFDTFTPIGPWIVTKDEIPNPDDINMVLKVNCEVRQKVNTRDLICNVAELISIYSKIMTLEPGDLIATGTPEGVGPIKKGDAIELEIEGIGQFEVKVDMA
ncbi:fumarylacetoacetate hydrolase family protein [Ferviditalea candida]|uniref:Fumarylacetoacetate hydrolase family protein n=1 Tax=Ferviditalea candida TaxID=3108399 RepID=A0ABU5ZDT2_9BACL|nr:fumarylacetoacetate hydrolase family protein [Paenibacillaceae bacterium T2]